MPIIRQMLCKPSVDALLFFFPSPLKNEAITGRAGKPGLNKVLFPVYLTSLLIDYIEQYAGEDPVENIGLKMIRGLADEMIYLSALNLNNLIIKI